MINKYIIYSLISASLIGVYYSIDKGISYADIFCPILSLFALYGFFSNRWKTNLFCRINIGYAVIMAIASVVNITFTNTVFINYFRIYIYGIIIYYCTYNSIRSRKDLKWFLFFISFYFVYFLININSIVQSSFIVGEGDYTSLSQQIIYGRNPLGFTAILFSLLVLFLYTTKILKFYICSIILGMSAFVIVLSASRFSVITFVLVLLYFLFVTYRHIGFGGFIKSIVIMLAFPLLASYLSSYVSSDILSSGIDLLTGKMEVIDSDVENVRIFAINVDPINNWMKSAKYLNYLIGDGLYIGHSVFAHTLLSTGLVGLAYYMYTNIKFSIVSYNKGTVYGKFLFLVVTVMLMNDLITNSRFIILLNNMLFMTIVAVISKSQWINFSKR